VNINRFIFILVAIGVFQLLFLPVLPLKDPTEGRYAVIAMDMHKTGEWIIPHIWYRGNRLPFLGKPPLHFWASAACMSVFGVNEFSARLPGLLSAFGLVLLLYFVLRRYNGRDVALTAILLTVCSPLFFFLSSAVIVDMSLAFFTAGAVIAYAAFLSESSLRIKRRWSLLVFFLLGCGFMVKGPVALVTFGLPVFFWTLFARQWHTVKNLTWIPGLAVFFLLTVPWFIAAEYQRPGFFKYFFVNENFLRYVVHDYGDRYGSGHQSPYFSAAVCAVIMTFPGCFLLFYYAIRDRCHLKKLLRPESPAASLGLFSVITITLFWCGARQFLITYLLALVPLFSMWFAPILTRKSRDLPYIRWGLLAVLCIAITVNLIATPFVIRHWSLRHMCKAIRTSTPHAKIISARLNPESLYFYAPDMVVQHDKEPVSNSVQRSRVFSTNGVLLIKKRYLDRIDEDTWQQLEIIEQRGAWTCVRWLSPSPAEKPKE
jgi:4-amino-4-deoxy-L-arabinose transferase-like glycosyltransferase